ncbi:hypothetical protein MP638_001928 [Amoeboaphelidium occidentale]|nr:hypothetical protein MP638_001928 [Amoeboaphelidium occidentale]
MEDKTNETPLPPGWEKAVTEDGKVYYIDHINRKTTWLDPRAPATETKTKSELPQGWEEAKTTDGVTYYVDHIRQITTFDHPLLHDYNREQSSGLPSKKRSLSNLKLPPPPLPEQLQTRHALTSVANLFILASIVAIISVLIVNDHELVRYIKRDLIFFWRRQVMPFIRLYIVDV